MGFDNECILNIQSLPGEYFCPVCRTLIYPDEALQTQCTHLYCKPCLAYVVATTKACPYDGYLVTETDSKPLVESNKPLAETIGKVTVHCLYNKSGCQWQGMLSACITHGTTCAYGNSPVICNRCGTQIVHRQVQEHVQLCPGMQSQTHQADSSQVQPLTGTAQAVTKNPALVSSAGSTVAAATTVPSATTATAVTASSVAARGSAGATTATMVVAPPSFSGASAPQASTSEHWYPQQYSQYYQQQYPGYNTYSQQHQQYGQYQQAYQQYTQPQMQVASQNNVQASAQSAQVMQSSQPQQMTQSQSQHQAQLQTSTGYPKTQLHQVQPQIQPSLPHLQAPQGQMQPVQSAYQVPPMQQHSQVPLQLTAPQTQPTVHQPVSTQVGNQQFTVPSTQATPHQIQPIVKAQPPQQQHTQIQTLPQQQNLQPQMHLNEQIQHQPPQVQQQSHAYPQPTPYMHPQNTSYPQQQMPPGAPLQQPPHASYQQGLVSQHPMPMRPPLPGLQLAVLPQGSQHIPQYQQQAGYHAQRPPMHPSIPSQVPQQGYPPHSSAPSQAGQSYQQGIPSTQQQVHSHPLQPYGPPYGQHHVTGHAYAGQQVQTSAGRPMNYAAPQQQFQPQSSCTVNNPQASVINQQPSMLGATGTGGKPTGQGSLASEMQALKSGKSENASGVAHNSAISEKRTDRAESSVMKPTISQPLNDERINGEKNDFGSRSKDVRTGVALDSTDISTGKDGTTGNSHAPGLQGGKQHKASDAYNNLEKGGSVQQASQKNAGPPGAYPPSSMGPQHPFGPDKMFHQHVMNSGPVPYDMQGQPNQIRPSKHSFTENTWPLMQQPYGSSHPGMAQRTFGENQIQSPMPHTTGIRPGDRTVRPPVVSPFPGRHDMIPSFVPDPLGRPHPPGTLKSNGFGGGPFVSGMDFHEEGFNAPEEHLRSFAAHTGRHNVDHNDIEDLKQFPVPGHLEMGPNSFKRTLEFVHHGADGMPNLRNAGPFVQGMNTGPGGVLKDFPGSVNLPGNAHHAFDDTVFPPFHPGHMHPDDHNLFADYSLHGFAKEPGHFDLGGIMRNTGAGWCRICMLNCGSLENLDLHVQTKEHQLCAMDLVLKMKQDVANRQMLNHGRPKPFRNKKVAGKGNFRGNKR